MAARAEIIRFCDELLDAQGFEDYCANGLQVPGRSEVTRIASGVSGHLELIERARDGGAQLLLVHHGLFWGSGARALDEQLATRLRAVLCPELSLAAYHLPLDAHREIGNNALLCRALGFEPAATELAFARGRAIGVVARRDPVPLPELVAAVASLAGREPLVFDSGPGEVASIGIVSGGGSRYLAEAAALGLDAFLTGEPSEPAMADAREGGINFIAAGHHATETLGVRRLGELVAERFAVEHEFIDVPNPV